MMPDKQRKAAFTLHASLLCAPDVAGEGGAAEGGGGGAGVVKAGVLEVLELGLGWGSEWWGGGGGGGGEIV